MDILVDKSTKKIQQTELKFVRYLDKQINWERRLIGIKGARGAGKTTLLLQYLKKKFGASEAALYVSLDDVYFSANKLVELANRFVKNGGQVLLLDEIHKYPNWSREIKNIYDDHADLKIIFTGSSILDIDKAEYDLSRRAVLYELNNLSLREYIELKNDQKLPSFTLNEIISNHRDISAQITNDIKPIKEFNSYLENGAYPFFLETGKDYHQHINRIINLILETDLPASISIEFNSVIKLKKLLYIISESVPFSPNISNLSSAMEVNRDTVIRHLQYLERAKLLYLVQSVGKGISKMSKPAKIYLENPNLMKALNAEKTNPGNLRETFFINQLSSFFEVKIPTKGDFLVDSKYLFEIGGKNKTYHQIANIENSFIVSDEIEFGSGNKIPIWLFGFLY
jgi:predicted AAA+ superfamily ATPase